MPSSVTRRRLGGCLFAGVLMRLRGALSARLAGACLLFYVVSFIGDDLARRAAPNDCAGQPDAEEHAVQN